jgi:hypothetical protein
MLVLVRDFNSRTSTMNKETNTFDKMICNSNNGKQLILSHTKKVKITFFTAQVHIHTHIHKYTVKWRIMFYL